MRFIESGPSVPDELLLARDQGRVVFFCGAGVSRAKANLPDFFGLAENVLAALGVAEGNAAAKILSEAREIEGRTGVAGLISADRIFGLLERDFFVRDIEAAVATALRPKAKPDLTAHRLLVELATTEQGAVRIVTTNFDRLFDDCRPDLASWQPPRLPDPKRSSDMSGIVYLHGKANAEYRGAEGDGFVLSSSEFGRAYLADGWATRFIREILEKYAVVFVGYTADDPPVQYLLEALNRSGGKLNEVYAFQSGSHGDATAKWEHKGVEAIAYDPADGHRALWETIEAWAVRARDPEGWMDALVDLARRGPEALKSWERGQVAHLVSTKEGARKFLGGDHPPPATWLCVFDKYRRYATPSKPLRGIEEGVWVDPFPSFSLDSDIAPAPIDPEDHYKRRDAPKDAWDAFQPNKWDRLDLRDENIPTLRGGTSLAEPNLPDRIGQLGVWISNVSNQNAAVWWAAHQYGLHSRIQGHIQWRLERTETECTAQVREAWQYLLEYWQSSNSFNDHEWFMFEAAITKSGWTNAKLRKYEVLHKPRLKIESNYFGGPMPPEAGAQVDLGALIKMEIEYRDDHSNVVVPDEWLSEAVAAHHRNLVFAIGLKKEWGQYHWDDTPPIVSVDDEEIDGYSRTHGFSGAVLRYAALFERLRVQDASAAIREMTKWDDRDEHVFARLRIWSVGFSDLVPDKMVGDMLGRLSTKAFWNPRHQRDLLLVLKARWPNLPLDTTRALEKRILAGRDRWPNESEAEFVERSAWAIAERLFWISQNGCQLNLDVDAELVRLKRAAPTWKEEYAEKAARSWESRGGLVRTDKEHSLLLQQPLSNVLAEAQELGGRTDDFLVQNDPFAGLCESHPVRAISALRLAAAENNYPPWAWRSFLNTQARINDSARFKAFIASTIARLPDEAINPFMHYASDWLLDASKGMKPGCLSHYDAVVSHIVGVLERNPNAGATAVIRQKRSADWATEALNAPTGKVAQALFHDTRTQGVASDSGLPKGWLGHLERILTLTGDMHRHALVILTHNLNWFHTIDPKWTEKNLLSILLCNDLDDLDAWWSGYLWGAHRLPNQRLFQWLKPYLLNKAAVEGEKDRDQNNKLAGLILASWGVENPENGERLISNEEFRRVLLAGGDQFRARVLWQIENWSKERNEGGVHWPDRLVEFLGEVWPVQKAAKTANSSARLVELAFAVPDRFMDVSARILPLLTKIERDHMLLPSVRREGGNIVDVHPERVLALLHAVLPDKVAAWPYEIDATLTRIGNAMPSLRQDERLIELNRKWNAR